jgi:hypothetical protein
VEVVVAVAVVAVAVVVVVVLVVAVSGQLQYATALTGPCSKPAMRRVCFANIAPYPVYTTPSPPIIKTSALVVSSTPPDPSNWNLELGTWNRTTSYSNWPHHQTFKLSRDQSRVFQTYSSGLREKSLPMMPSPVTFASSTASCSVASKNGWYLESDEVELRVSQ